MASSINASLTNGIVQTADTSGILNLQSNGTTIASVSSTGVAVTGTLSASNLQGPAFSASPSSNQTISHNTNTKVLLQTEQYDTNNNFASSTFTPTTAGYYNVAGQVRIDFTAGRQLLVQLSIYKNGTSYLGQETSFVVGTGSSFSSNINATVPMNGSTDTIELYIYLYDYTSATSYSTNATQSRLQGFLVRTL